MARARFDRSSRRDARPTFALVHGAHSNSWSWSPLLQELALRGHRGLAVDLPGHGLDGYFPVSYQAPQDLQSFTTQESPLASITLQDNVDHVVAAVRRVADFGPVILVGLSAGGATISGVGNAVPELLDGIVYISAWCCVELPAVAAYLETLGIHDVAATMVNWRSADTDQLAMMKQNLVADATDNQFHACLNLLEPADSAQVLNTECRVRADTWGRLARTYIRFSHDRAIPLAMQDRMIAEADALTPDNPFVVHTIDTTHLGTYLHAAQIADILDALSTAEQAEPSNASEPISNPLPH